MNDSCPNLDVVKNGKRKIIDINMIDVGYAYPSVLIHSQKINE